MFVCDKNKDTPIWIGSIAQLKMAVKLLKDIVGRLICSILQYLLTTKTHLPVMIALESWGFDWIPTEVTKTLCPIGQLAHLLVRCLFKCVLLSAQLSTHYQPQCNARLVISYHVKFDFFSQQFGPRDKKKRKVLFLRKFPRDQRSSKRDYLRYFRLTDSAAVSITTTITKRSQSMMVGSLYAQVNVSWESVKSKGRYHESSWIT